MDYKLVLTGLTSVFMLIPYIILTEVFSMLTKLDFVFVGVSVQLLMLLPLILFEMSGSKYGVLSAVIFTLSVFLYSIFTVDMNIPTTFSLLLSFFFNPFSNGIASYRLENKKLSILLIFIAIVIQVFFRFLTLSLNRIV